MIDNERAKSFDDSEPLDAPEELTAEEQAAWDRMQAETPMPTKHEGGDPDGGGELLAPKG